MILSASLRGGLAIALALGLAACGQAGPGALGQAPDGAFAARAGGWKPFVTLEDFSEDPAYRFDFHGPGYGHPFYEPVNFSKQKAAGSAVLELVAPNSLKQRKGYYMRMLDPEEGSFEYQAGEKDGEPIMKLAARVQVGFNWANNTTASSETSLSAMAVYVVQSRQNGPMALAYAWTNTLAPGRVIVSQLRLDDETIPMRILTIEKGNGLGEQCSEAALAKMRFNPPAGQAFTVQRDLVADVRYAYDKATPVSDPNALVTDDRESNKAFNPPAGAPNTDLVGLLAVGVGAEVPRGICAHAIIDDLSFRLKPKD